LKFYNYSYICKKAKNMEEKKEKEKDIPKKKLPKEKALKKTEKKPEISPDDEKIPLNLRIRSFLKGRQDEIELMLQKMVNMNSYVRNVEGVNELSNFIKKHLSVLGFAYQVIPQVEVGNILFYTNVNQEDYEILLLINLDDSTRISSHEYYHKGETKIFGSGVWEHKGGLVVMLAALQALRFTRSLKKLKIAILLTTDDALQGKFAKSIVNKKAQQAKFIIGLHGASLNGSLVTSRSGAAVYNCEMNLIKAQTAQDVAVASSAFLHMVSAWADLSEVENGLIVAPSKTLITSNIAFPFAHGTVNLSIRFNTNDQIHNFDEKIKRLIPRKYRDLIHFQVNGGIRRPPMPNTSRIDRMFNIIKRIADKLEISLEKEHRWNSADICFVDKNKFIIDGMGPAGTKPSKRSEYIVRKSILERSELLAMTLHELKKMYFQST